MTTMSAQTGLEMLDDFIFELRAATAPSSSCASAKPKQPKEKKEAKDKAPRVSSKTNAPAPSKEDLNLNSLDLRVGQIVSVKKHETADKLYCEEVAQSL
jgi:aminoacyl tRNA synthase complex-interacting multifunctional protein 1